MTRKLPADIASPEERGAVPKAGGCVAVGRTITTTYSDEEKQIIIGHVLTQVSCGRSVSEILEDDDGMPDQATFWRWHLDDFDDLRGNLASARENGVEARMEEAVKVARKPMMGEIVTVERDPEAQKDIEEGAEPTNAATGEPYEGMIVKVRKEDMLGHRKLLVDTLIKSAQMLKPKTYGPKLDLTSAGEKIGLSAEIEASRRRAADGAE
jgi:hypothetical protein